MTGRATAAFHRAAAALAAAVIALPVLTSCTPEIKAVTGVTVDANGRPLAALAWCADRPPTVVVLHAVEEPATLTRSNPTDATPHRPFSFAMRQYIVPPEVTSPATVPLAHFPPAAAASDATFRMYGVGHRNSFTSRRVVFQLAELDDLVPGSVIITAYTDGEMVQRTVALDEFARLGEDQC
jgi:hypothetical protein